METGLIPNRGSRTAFHYPIRGSTGAPCRWGAAKPRSIPAGCRRAPQTAGGAQKRGSCGSRKEPAASRPRRWVPAALP